MDHLLSSKFLLSGFRFHPTDEELVMFYLKRKVLGKSIHSQMISEIDVYRFAPWDLPSKSYLKTKDLIWYFFCPQSRKYANGGRTIRLTEQGYWKSTGNDRTVQHNHRPVGKIKTLIFHLGKPPNGDRTDWVMHEYRLEDKLLAEKGAHQDAYVICKIYKKSGRGPKNGEDHGAPFVEQECESDDDDNMDLEKASVIMNTPDIAATISGVNVNELVTMNTPNIAVVASTPSKEQLMTNAVIYENASVMMNTLNRAAVGAASTPSTEQLMTNVVGTQNIVAAFASSSSAAAQLATPETEVDEIGRLLTMFTENKNLVSGTKELFDNDICQGLGDLADGFCSHQGGSSWLEYFSDDYFEVKDLGQNMK